MPRPAKPAAGLTDTQRDLVAHAVIVAENAHRTLGMRAGDGAKARPTLAQINSTLERLASIKATLEAVLA